MLPLKGILGMGVLAGLLGLGVSNLQAQTLSCHEKYLVAIFPNLTPPVLANTVMNIGRSLTLHPKPFGRYGFPQMVDPKSNADISLPRWKTTILLSQIQGLANELNQAALAYGQDQNKLDKGLQTDPRLHHMVWQLAVDQTVAAMQSRYCP